LFKTCLQFKTKLNQQIGITTMAVAEIMAKLTDAFNADAADDLEATFQFMIEGDDDFYITIEDEECSAGAGEHDDPDITMIMDVDTLKEIVTGELDGMAAFMGGRLKAEGDVMLGTRLGQLFDLG
jgi:putative sterol carrier protein